MPQTQDVENRRDLFRGIIGNSAVMRSVCERAKQVAATDASILITGESGTGKDLLAEAIHGESRRRNGPYVGVSMAAVPESLVESNLFGHVKGAFTGAGEKRRGFFEAAHGGTLFIDEIGDLKLTSQVKLLRVLETRQVTPVGDDRARGVDVRIIAATNRNLEAMVAQKRFREDLYYRLNVVAIEMPPLRERPDDIPALVTHFSNGLSEAYECASPRVNTELERFLIDYAWPGNVRQLRNCVESMFVLAQSDELTLKDLPEMVRNENLVGRRRFDMPHNLTLGELEKEAILQTLNRCKGNRTKAARTLEISVRTLQRKLKRWNETNSAGRPEVRFMDRHHNDRAARHAPRIS